MQIQLGSAIPENKLPHEITSRLNWNKDKRAFDTVRIVDGLSDYAVTESAQLVRWRSRQGARAGFVKPEYRQPRFARLPEGYRYRICHAGRKTVLWQRDIVRALADAKPWYVD